MTASPSPKRPYAGGFLIVAGLLAGCVAGVALNQVTASVLVGGGIGVALALVLWAVDRR